MNRTVAIIALVLLGVLAGCSKDNPVTPPPSTEDWTFPANGSKFAITLYSDQTTVAVGQTLEVKVLLYNVSNVFGAAVGLRMPSDTLAVTSVVTGPVFSSANPLVLSVVDTVKHQVDYGITLRSGSMSAFSGSGVLFKLKVRPVHAGPFTVSVIPATFALQDGSGNPITGFGSIVLEGLSATAN